MGTRVQGALFRPASPALWQGPKRPAVPLQACCWFSQRTLQKTCLRSLTYMYVHRHLHIHTHTHFLHMHTRTCTNTHTCTYIHPYIHIHTSVRRYIRACMRAHTHTHACMHACIHTYIYYAHASMLLVGMPCCVTYSMHARSPMSQLLVRACLPVSPFVSRL